jgi:DNA polymerase
MGLTSWVLRHPPVPEDVPETGLQTISPSARRGGESAPPVTGPAPNPGSPAPAAEISGLPWPALEAAVSGCEACELHRHRTQTVFGVGSHTARWLFIGEAPGVEEDRRGEPFVGRAGQLLDAMLAALGLNRQQVFIANVLKCRPPGNRDPRPEESRACAPYLDRQIELIDPGVIVALGRISAQQLLGSDKPLGSLRGRVHQLGPDNRPLVVTYHPAYLLRQPSQKARAWEDLLLARRLPAPDTGSDERG